MIDTEDTRNRRAENTFFDGRNMGSRATGDQWLIRISVALLACLLPEAGHAASILASVGPVPGFGYPNGTTIVTPGSVSYYDGSGGGATASVGFDFAGLHAGSNCGNSVNCGAIASADFSDAITIFGTIGFLKADIFSRATALFSDGNAGTSFLFGSFRNGSIVGFNNGTFSYQQNFTAGNKVLFSGSAIVGANDFAPEDPFSGSETVDAGVFFSFAVLDSNGQPLSGFQYTSDSGTDYKLAGGVFIPESTTVILTLTGLLSMILRRVRRLPKVQFILVPMKGHCDPILPLGEGSNFITHLRGDSYT